MGVSTDHSIHGQYSHADLVTSELVMALGLGIIILYGPIRAKAQGQWVCGRMPYKSPPLICNRDRIKDLPRQANGSSKLGRRVCSGERQLAHQRTHLPDLTPKYGKKFVPDLNTVYVRDLNFVLRWEIFFHYDGQLLAFHLIFSVTPVYTSYQPFGQALTVGSLLLSYIDVRHQGFFPPRLTVGEARDLGPCLIRVSSLVLARDKSVDTIFQGRAVYTPVEEQRTEVPATK
ncbi:hypothetical protein SO802_031249 [Lithocarpus litseifolius]|uniref:Uncharacterized protein n=1 Tax=Lithocarpus litseifolius TaxID=425828 RepID=A0AAW2BLQ2_9ROSI